MSTENRRRISEVGGMIEVAPPPSRQITEAAAMTEIEFGHYRQITEVGVLAEIAPCIEQLGDYGYEDKQFYLEKLQYLKDNHGSQADLTPYQGCISVAQLAELKQLYINEAVAILSSILGFPFDPGEIE